jgi:cell fate (sporulation/competence/biofilm development) regulator YlbF (YheA/YmcA/DUF963 family)
MVEQATEHFGDLGHIPLDDSRHTLFDALQSSSYRRRYRKEWKAVRLPDLRTEAQDQRWKALRTFLTELEEDLRRRGYRPDMRRIRKAGELEEEYEARTQELVEELYQEPQALSEILSPIQTLDLRDVGNALRLLGGERGYYLHLVGLIYDIRRDPHGVGLTKAHAYNLSKAIVGMMGLDIDGLKDLHDRGDARGLTVFLEKLWQLLDSEDRVLEIGQRMMRPVIVESITGASGIKGLRKTDSLEIPVGEEDLTLGDTIVDRKAKEDFLRAEELNILELELADLPAAQRRDVELILKAERAGDSLERFLAREGITRPLKSVQRNYQRAVNALERRRKRQQ